MIMRILTLLLWGLSSGVSASTIEAPERFMQQATEAVIVDLKDLSSDDTNGIYALIDKNIIPIVDIEYMSRWMAGRKAWKQATSEQKKIFQATFQKLMTKTYASTVLIFKDQEMTYSRPARVDYYKVKTIPVYCEIKQSNKESIQVIYQLRLVHKQWKIFDVLVEGVSMLKGLKSQYEPSISQKGLEGGIATMNAKLHHASNTVAQESSQDD